MTDRVPMTTMTTKSYYRAQERQRVAEALKMAAELRAAQSNDWARDCLDRERKMADRATYLYGLASRLGATPEQLRGE